MAFLKVFVWFLALLLLPGCVDTTKTVTGEIVEYQVDTDDSLTALVIQTDEGETVGLVPAEGEEIYTFSWLPGNTVTEFREMYPYTVKVSAKCQRKKTTLQRQDGTEIPAYVAEWVTDGDKLIQPGAYTFSDGETVDLWEGSFFRHSYVLSDGTTLLHMDGHGPVNTHMGNLVSFDHLSPGAQEKVLAFYEEQGLLYDELEELEKAYRFYTADPEHYVSLMAGQDILPCFSNENILSFTTTVTLPLKPGHITEIRLTHTFDRETGEQISNYDLFTVPPEELMVTLLELNSYENWEDAPSIEEMQAALKPEYIRLSEAHISFDFPAGTLPSQDHSFSFGLSHFGQEWDVLQPWAQPDISQK